MIKEYLNICLLIFLAVSVSCNSGSKEKKQKRELKSSDKPEEKLSDVAMTPEDTLIFVSVVEWAQTTKLTEKSLDSVIIEVALFFQGSPYVANTLEQEGPEQLVVNLREFDCATYVESVLALSFCISSGDMTFSDFLRELQSLRYRHGVIDQYTSRLHYYSEWIVNNQNKGLLKVVSEDFGDEDFEIHVNFMSNNPEKYPTLADNPEFVEKISGFEGQISKETFKMVSEEEIENVQNQIRNGDIIAFTSGIEGLDILHLGFAIHTGEGELRFIHASTNGNKVRISEKILSEYVHQRKDCPGIIVVRPVS